jgi:hypothetical protein
MSSRVFFVVAVFLLLVSRCPGQQSSAPLSETSGVIVEPMNDIIAAWEQRSEKDRVAAYWWSAAEALPGSIRPCRIPPSTSVAKRLDAMHAGFIRASYT